MSGYLDKQSPKFPFPWQKRFFEVQLKPKPLLMYYQKAGDVAPKGTIAADKIANVTIESRRGRKTRIVISLSSTARKYYLRASTPENCQTWYDTIRRLMEMTEQKQMDNGPSHTSGQKAEESKENLDAMYLVHNNLVKGLREASSILSSNKCFQRFALHMEHQSYFDLAFFAPIFGNYFRAVLAFRNPNFEVHLKLDDVSSVDLESLKFDGFLDEVQKTPFVTKLTAERMETMVTAAAQKTIEKLKKYIKEAENVKDDDVVGGLSKIVDLFRCLTEE